MVYVANFLGESVTVIYGATGATTDVPTGSGACALAINSVTNRIYVANYYNHSVTVIDGATNATTTIAIGPSPSFDCREPPNQSDLRRRREHNRYRWSHQLGDSTGWNRVTLRGGG